jgi:hypothetical protein
VLKYLKNRGYLKSYKIYVFITHISISMTVF